MVSWEVIWIIRPDKILRVCCRISGVGRSLSLANNGNIVLNNASHRRIMLYEVDGLGVHQI